MKVIYEYFHLGGAEILKVKYPAYDREIYDIIASIKANRTKISKEKTIKGRALYSPKDMNAQFRRLFNEKGYF